MDKFLFTDGTNGVVEAQTQEELQVLIDSAEQPDRIRIWIFSSNEWISHAAFRKRVPALASKQKPVTSRPVANELLASNGQQQPSPLNGHASYSKPAKRSHGLKKFLYIIGLGAVIFLVFNFTKIKWEKDEPVHTSAARPANVPIMDIDSLFTEIEYARGQALDRSTRTNLRLRNTWPDRILLKLEADKETSGAGSRFFNAAISIDNTTGFNIDNAVVRLSVWKEKELSLTDTLHFSNIRYDKLSTRMLDARYKGDSISVAFESVRAKSFNFCYSAATKNNSGNYNDRWFCRE